jgi:hypothetical protein
VPLADIAVIVCATRDTEFSSSSQSFQCHKLVNIFEMVPPVQRIAIVSLLFYRNQLLPSIQFRIPWTGGNPKPAAKSCCNLISNSGLDVPIVVDFPQQLSAAGFNSPTRFSHKGSKICVYLK